MNLPLSLLTSPWLSFLCEKHSKETERKKKHSIWKLQDFFNLILEMTQCYFCRVMPGTQNNTATIGGEKTKKGGSLEAT